MGAAAVPGAFPETAGRKHGIVQQKSVIVDKQNVQRGCNPAVLVCVIKNYDLRPAGFKQTVYAMNPVFTYGYVNIGKTVPDLHRLISDDTAGCRAIGQDITFGASAVTAAQDGRAEPLLNQFCKILCMGGLSRTSYGYVPDAYYRNGEGRTFDYSSIVNTVTDI
jgi:hypothetical protein